MRIDIKNCNNIDEGMLDIIENRPNTKYAINGTGKSTISKAIDALVNDDKDKKRSLLPFRYWGKDNGGMPELIGGESKVFVSDMLSKQSGDGDDAEEGYYGYGMWIIDNPNGKDFAYFQGCDPGVSFISEYNPNNGIISVLVSNYGDNAWREMRKVREVFY